MDGRVSFRPRQRPSAVHKRRKQLNMDGVLASGPTGPDYWLRISTSLAALSSGTPRCIRIGFDANGVGLGSPPEAGMRRKHSPQTLPPHRQASELAVAGAAMRRRLRPRRLTANWRSPKLCQAPTAGTAAPWLGPEGGAWWPIAIRAGSKPSAVRAVPSPGGARITRVPDARCLFGLGLGVGSEQPRGDDEPRPSAAEDFDLEVYPAAAMEGVPPRSTAARMAS